MSFKVSGIEDVNRILGDLAPKEARNLMRAVTFDIAKQAAEAATGFTPDDPSTGVGDLKSSIKARRDRGDRTKTEASVRVKNPTRNYFWKFLEYGDGPDGVEHAMFAKALEKIRPDMPKIYVEAFARKLIARLKRERKRVG